LAEEEASRKLIKELANEEKEKVQERKNEEASFKLAQ
jgi:hypothetical protein